MKKDFEGISFKGVFRVYQQRVLDNSDKYLLDKKVNIVAAPGSGKTVLGLELIRRVNSPTIVFSPTTAIREQWGDRFKEMFLPDGVSLESVFSNDLHDVKLLTSVTYQALYSAIERKSVSQEEGEVEKDCADIDIFSLIKEFNIKTICLDEAHHLKNEWQRALEKFITLLDKDITIISLTATPPYDCESAEWERYEKICGEIDEEIFVPELVSQSTLCPHQDYVYFNYPSEAEIEEIKAYKEKAELAMKEIAGLDFIAKLLDSINRLDDYESLFSNAKEYTSLLIYLSEYGFEIDKRVIKQLTAKNKLPSFKAQYAEVAVQFLLDCDKLLEQEREQIYSVLKKHSVCERRKVSFTLNEKLKRKLISSVGKLSSIRDIVISENECLGKDLRLLILTDYIRKESLSSIASDKTFNSVNIVSIFETLRRADDSINIGVLSGSLIILPNSIDLKAFKHKSKPLAGTRYSVVDFAGSNYDSVDIVGNFFKQGLINVLVGTKSLLGEGWDAPCINSLVLASFVGSFVLSNQMRGRAIRIDKNNPNKVSNIWHLVTVEPEQLFNKRAKVNENTLTSCDFDVLKRRFDSFMGPNYESGKIQSGINRITAIKPPYNEQGVVNINNRMLNLSKQRRVVKSTWQGEVCGSNAHVITQTDISKESSVPVVGFLNITVLSILSFIQAIMIYMVVFSLEAVTTGVGVFLVALEVVVLYALYKILRKIIMHITPARSIKTLGESVYRTLMELNLLSPGARVITEKDDDLQLIALMLENASIRDQNVFNTAMEELLSPIENPRYILIKMDMFGRYDYKCSYACPSVIGKKKEYVQVFKKHLRYDTGDFDLVYTHREDGMKFILKCRKNSYITHNAKQIDKHFAVSNRK